MSTPRFMDQKEFESLPGGTVLTGWDGLTYIKLNKSSYQYHLEDGLFNPRTGELITHFTQVDGLHHVHTNRRDER